MLTLLVLINSYTMAKRKKITDTPGQSSLACFFHTIKGIELEGNTETKLLTLVELTLVNPRSECAARVTVLGSCVCVCVCVCVCPLHFGH